MHVVTTKYTLADFLKYKKIGGVCRCFLLHISRLIEAILMSAYTVVVAIIVHVIKVRAQVATKFALVIEFHRSKTPSVTGDDAFNKAKLVIAVATATSTAAAAYDDSVGVLVLFVEVGSNVFVLEAASDLLGLGSTSRDVIPVFEEPTMQSTCASLKFACNANASVAPSPGHLSKRSLLLYELTTREDIWLPSSTATMQAMHASLLT